MKLPLIFSMLLVACGPAASVRESAAIVADAGRAAADAAPVAEPSPVVIVAEDAGDAPDTSVDLADVVAPEPAPDASPIPDAAKPVEDAAVTPDAAEPIDSGPPPAWYSCGPIPSSDWMCGGEHYYTCGFTGVPVPPTGVIDAGKGCSRYGTSTEAFCCP